MLAWDLFSKFVLSSRAGSLVRRISFLTMISIFLSVTAFLVVLFVMNGMNDTMKKRIMGLEPHLVVTSRNAAVLGQLKNSDALMKLQETPGVSVLDYEKQDLIVKTLEGQFRGVQAWGVTPESLEYLLKALKGIHVNTGAKDYTETSGIEIPSVEEVLMGSDLARNLGVFEGDFITFVSPESLLLPAGTVPKIEKLKVKQIITTTLPDIDGQAVYYLRGSGLSRLPQMGMLESGVEIHLPDGYKAGVVKELFPKIADLRVETWMERNASLFFALKMEKINIGVFLGLAGLIAGSSILTVLTLLMSVKRRDIALLRTLGLSEKQTVHLFTLIGLFLSLVGVVAGVVVGTGLSLYIQANPLHILPDIYYDSEIPAKVEWSLIFVVLSVATVLGLFGAYLPAKQARKMEPASLLRLKH